MEAKCGVYEAADIQKILKISKTSVYNFLADAYKNKSPFRVIKIGTLYRVPKAEFDQWLYGNGGQDYA